MWSHTFDNRRRHCWLLADGTFRLDSTALFSDDVDDDDICTADHSADPKVVGKVEWMRFIHAVGERIGYDSPFLCNEVHVTQHEEEYTDEEGRTVVKLVFKRAPDVVEMTLAAEDECLAVLFNEALKDVEESYGSNA